MTDILDVRSGTISGTGATPACFGQSVDIVVGDTTSTLVLEVLMSSGGWKVVETIVPADYAKTYGQPGDPFSVIRINCTAYADDAEYDMIAREDYMVAAAKALQIETTEA